MNSRKKILFLSSWYPNDTHPTLGNFVQRHAEAVAKFHDVSLLYITIRKEQKELFEISDNNIRGVRTLIVYFKPGKIKMASFRMAFRKGLRYLDFKGKSSFDLVHLNVILNQGWQALYLKKRYGIPYVITEHWTGFHDRPEKRIQGARKLMAQMITENSRFVIPVSQHLGRAMQAFGLKGNYHVVENVVDTELFNISENSDNNFTFLHISHLGDAHKNITGIIRTFAEFLKINPDTVLKVIGDGDINPYIKLQEELNISSQNLIIEGEKSISEVAKLMSEANVFVLFSNYENLPCVIIEAFACGLPVISTDVGGVSEILNKERGYLIEKGNENELLKSMLVIYENYQTFDKVNVRKYAVNEFSINRIGQKFNDLYTDLK